ncbi:tetratricopeptide repeat protein [bacterium]|nr:tetratricopeptide repeat protein [bacterium]
MPFSFRLLAQWILCALALGACLVFAPQLSDYANLPQGVVLQVGAALALALSLYGFRDKAFQFGFFDIAVAAWIIWMGLSLLWTPDTNHGINLWAQWLAATGLALACGRCQSTEGFTQKILTLFFISGALVATVGIFQFLLPLKMDWIPLTKGPAAMFGNRNMAVEYLLLTLPLGWVLFLKARCPFKILLSGLGCALIGVFFTYTLSRTGILFSVFQALLLVGFLIAKRTRALLLPTGWTRLHTLAVACCLAVFLILSNLTSHGFEWRWKSAAQETEKMKPPLFHEKGGVLPDERTMLYQNTWAMAKDRPVAGFGLGSFKSLYPAYARSNVVDPHFTLDFQPEETHNDFLQFWAELGAIGAFLFVALLFLFFREAWTGLNSPHAAWCMAMGLAGIGLVLDALVNFPLYRGPLPPFVFLVYGVLMRNKRWEWKPNTRVMSAIAITCVLLCMIALSWGITRLAADRHLAASFRASEKQDWPRALSEIEAAHQLDPGNKLILFTAAWTNTITGNKAKAVLLYEEGLKHYPYSPNHLWNAGMTYMDLGQLDNALSYFKRAITVLPDEAGFHFYLAVLYRKRGEMDKAKVAYDKAIKLNSELISVPLQ